jgi:hypothetical protein
MRRLVICALACLATAATGCGDDGPVARSGRAQEQVRATLAALADADRTGDYNRYCELLSGASVRAVVQLGGGQDCAAAMRSSGIGHNAASVATLAAAQIVVKGDRAVARTPDDGSGVSLVREQDRWRVEILGPQTPRAAAGTPPAPVDPPAVGIAPEASARYDSAVKSEVRNAVSNIESCRADANTYVGCAPGVGVGTVEVRNATADTYEVIARTDAGNEYRMVRGPDGTFQRVCTPAVATTSCSQGSW